MGQPVEFLLARVLYGGADQWRVWDFKLGHSSPGGRHCGAGRLARAPWRHHPRGRGEWGARRARGQCGRQCGYTRGVESPEEAVMLRYERRWIVVVCDYQDWRDMVHAGYCLAVSAMRLCGLLWAGGVAPAGC